MYPKVKDNISGCEIMSIDQHKDYLQWETIMESFTENLEKLETGTIIKEPAHLVCTHAYAHTVE